MNMKSAAAEPLSIDHLDTDQLAGRTLQLLLEQCISADKITLIRFDEKA